MSAPPCMPGPWVADRDTPHNVMPRVHGADGSLVCEVGNMANDQDQWEANARLIAAAPDYDAGVEQMLAYEQAGGDGWWKGWEMLKAAHAKARGEQA